MATVIRNPLIIAAGIAWLGCASARQWPLFPIGISLSLCLAGAGLALRYRAQWLGALGICLGVFFLYVSDYQWNSRFYQADLTALGDRRDITLIGKIASIIHENPQTHSWAGTLNCQSLVWKNKTSEIHGVVRFLFPGKPPELIPGDTIQIAGCLQKFPLPKNPGEFNSREWNQNQGIFGQLIGKTNQDITCLQHATWYSSWDSCGGVLHAALIRALERCIEEKARGMVLALVAGERWRLSSREKENLVLTGLAHIIAISGSNIGIIYTSLLVIGKLVRRRREVGIILGLIGILAYSLAVGTEASVIRALIMMGCIGLNQLLFKQADSWASLGLAGLIILWGTPQLYADVGFQLSFLATAAILGCLPILAEGFNTAPKVLLAGLIGVGISLATFLFTAAITVGNFYTLTPGAILGNLIALPLLDLMLVSAFATILAETVCPPLVWIGTKLCSGSAWGLQATVELIQLIPGYKVYCWPAPGWWIAIYLGGLSLTLWKKQWRWLGLSGLAGWLLLYPLFAPTGVGSGIMRITFLSLKWGEAALVESSDKARVLIDTGTEQEFVWRVKPFLASRGIQTLDAVVFSHTDADHAGGVLACFKYFHVLKIITGPLPTTRFSTALMTEIKKQKTQVEIQYQGRRCQIASGLQLKTIWPPPGVVQQGNQAGLAVWIIGEGGAALFTGDCGRLVESRLIIQETCRVFKAAHHGDADANTEVLLSHLQPEVSVVTPGNSNPFGLPDLATLRRLKKYSAIVLNTQTEGAIEIELQSGHPVRWRCFGQ